MKKIFFTAMAVTATVACCLAFRNAPQRELTKLERANVEALADDEEFPRPIYCLGDGDGCYLGGYYKGPYLMHWNDGSTGLD